MISKTLNHHIAFNQCFSKISRLQETSLTLESNYFVRTHCKTFDWKHYKFGETVPIKKKSII